MGRDQHDFDRKMREANREVDALYEEAINAMRERRASESQAAALCIIGGCVFAAVMAAALWVGKALVGV